MDFDDSVEAVVGRALHALQAAEVPYMLVGSFASAFHGSPRTTQDIDVVIAPTLGSLQKLIKQFPEDEYYVSRDAALQAYGAETLFNVVDFRTGWKIDFIICKSREYNVQEFARRQEAELLGARLYVASAEDVVLSKLEWAKQTESERQIRDVAGILWTKGDSLDREYLRRWIQPLNISEQLVKALNEAGLTQSWIRQASLP
jgi:predicted nucleotidyltransferase